MITEPLVVVGLTLLAATCCVVLAWAVVRWRATHPSAVARVVSDWLLQIVDVGFQGAIHQFDRLSPELRGQRLDEFARKLYGFLPAVTTFRIRGQAVVVPLKWLIPEEQFVVFVRAVADSALDMMTVFRQSLEAAYRQFRNDPTQIARASHILRARRRR